MREHEPSLINKIGIGIFMVGAIVPALAVSGFFFPLDLVIAFAIASLGGAIGGALFAYGQSSVVIAALAGPIAAVGALALTWIWIRNRSSIWNFELAITMILGSLPGLGLGVLANRMWASLRS